MADAHRAAAAIVGRTALVTLGLLQVLVAGLLWAATRVVPVGVAVGLWLLWAAVGVLGWRWRRRHAIATMLLPFVAAGATLAALTLVR